jgi:predicted PurR-regulated permease PerM
MVGVPPIISILALIIGAKLGGFMGILLSMPIVTILVEISNDFEKKKRPATDIAVDVSES